MIQAQTQAQRDAVTRPAIEQRGIFTQHPDSAGFWSIIIHRNPLITGNIDAHALQQLSIVPATAEQRGDSREGENRERRAPGPASWRESPSRR
nr:Uncharacterised protein [Klebsiella pneumoniae]